MYAAANIGLVLYGVMLLVQPGVLLEPFLLHVYRLPQDAISAIAYLEALFRLLGYFNLVLGVLGLLLLRRLVVSHEMWIARIVIVSTIFAYLGPILFDNTVGSIGTFEVIEHVLFALAILLGFLMWRGGQVSSGIGLSPSFDARSRSGESTK